jgi:hypothetical protein
VKGARKASKIGLAPLFWPRAIRTIRRKSWSFPSPIARQANLAEALELPAAIKRHLGLDAERSWVVLNESNLFDWPGPDLRRVGDRDDSSVAYGFLPPRFFAELHRRFVALETAARSRRVQRTE